MAPLISIRPQERRETLTAAAVLFAVLVGHSLLETARDSLFLASLPAARLPWAYLAITACVVFATRWNQKLAAKCRKQKLFTRSLVTLGVGTAAFWPELAAGASWALYALYVWTGVVATLLVVQFWLVLGDVFTVQQAKRIYALIGVGAMLGATAGSGLASGLLMVMAPHHLVLASGLVFVAAAGISTQLRTGESERAFAPRARDPAEQAALKERLRHGQPYLRRLTWLVVASAITVTGADFLFKSVVAETIPSAELGGFFSRYYTVLNGIGVVVQLGVAPWLLRRWGVNRTLLIMPILLLGAAGAFVGFLTLLPVMIMRGVDGALRHSVQRTSMELLYLPLASDVRAHCKGLIDGVGQRGAQALASVLILAATAWGATNQHVGWAVLGLAFVWLGGVVGLKRHYIHLYRSRLREGVVDTRVSMPDLDLNSLEALLGAVNSSEDAEVIAALDMFEAHDKTHLVPALILYHPSRDVVERAIAVFGRAKRQDVAPVAKRLLQHEDDELRAAALGLYVAASGDRTTLQQYAEDPSASVRISALVGAIELGAMTEDVGLDRLRQVIRGDCETSRRLLARAVRFRESPLFEQALIEMAQIDDTLLLREVVQTMAASTRSAYLPHLIDMLRHRNIRHQVRAAIVALGAEALRGLDQALEDESLPRRIRVHIPRTISRFGSPAATQILLKHLKTQHSGKIRFKILRGLGRMRADDPGLPVDETFIQEEIHRVLVRASQMLRWRVGFEAAMSRTASRASEGGELLLSLLKEKERNAVTRLFRFFKVLRPQEDFDLIYQGLHSPNPMRRANSQELVELVVRPEWRPTVLALVSDAPDAERLRGTQGILEEEERSKGGIEHDRTFQGYLSAMLRDSSDTVRSVAAYYVGELGLSELREEVATIRSDGALNPVFEHALSLLDNLRSPVVADAN